MICGYRRSPASITKPDRIVKSDMKSMWVDVDDGRLYVEVAGRGEPILLVHGWPLDHRMFAPQVVELREHFTAITYDRRGFGKSEARPDLRLELDDIDRILDHIGLPSVHLLGMSQGGRIALRYAVTRPQRIRSLLLQGAVVDGIDVRDSTDDHVPVAEYAKLVGDGKLAQVVSRWLRHPMMWLGDNQEAAQRLLQTILEDYSGSDLINYDEHSYVFDGDVLAAMGNFPRPTLLLTGARETETRRLHANVLKQHIPSCREVIFEKSGHLSNLTEPQNFNRTVIDFCNSVDSHVAPSGSGTLD